MDTQSHRYVERHSSTHIYAETPRHRDTETQTHTHKHKSSDMRKRHLDTERIREVRCRRSTKARRETYERKGEICARQAAV